jgi:hypothetical protein
MQDIAEGLPAVTSDELIGPIGAGHSAERITGIAVTGVPEQYLAC